MLATGKNQKPYNSFLSDARESIDLFVDIFAYIVAMFVFIEIFAVSRLCDFLSNLQRPSFTFLGVPTELSKLVLLKLFSGNGGLAILQNIFDKYGAGNYISRCDAMILTSSDTEFYVVKEKKW